MPVSALILLGNGFFWCCLQPPLLLNVKTLVCYREGNCKQVLGASGQPMGEGLPFVHTQHALHPLLPPGHKGLDVFDLLGAQATPLVQ